MKKLRTNLAKNERLEDFGMREALTDEEKWREILRQSKELDPRKRVEYIMHFIKTDKKMAHQAHFKVVK